ncbi:NAD(P)-binding domain-containing protein [Winogradskyella sp.]|uniref:NAD(P)-binding domain-containing protein n=1 Tax=Winogradskyella sp. TaxID=1883156 RepID=UPI003BAB584B
MKTNYLPIAVIGAGPIGLAAAAHIVNRKARPLVFEVSDSIAGNVKSWGHVTMFSQWKLNIDKVSQNILEKNGWQAPEGETIPTGNDLVEQYLRPLSQTNELQSHIKLGAKVVAISRQRINKSKDAHRDRAPFIIRVLENGKLNSYKARAVIDASGTWSNPNPMGSDGLFAVGEKEHRSHIFYGIPNVLGVHKKRYQSKEVAVVGSGHSAINTILDLVDLKHEFPSVKIKWLLRKKSITDIYGGLDNDELPGRGRLGHKIKAIVESNYIEVITPFFIDEIMRSKNKLMIKGISDSHNNFVSTDEIIVSTGLRPDIQLFRELRISLDAALESPIRLAPLINPNIHSCGTVAPHGATELQHPEKDFYVVGMKSYGRAPTFLLTTGYEQVRSVVAAIEGDWKSAKEVHLELPKTGVCGVAKSINPNGFDKEKNDINVPCC